MRMYLVHHRLSLAWSGGWWSGREGEEWEGVRVERGGGRKREGEVERGERGREGARQESECERLPTTKRERGEGEGRRGLGKGGGRGKRKRQGGEGDRLTDYTPRSAQSRA